MASKVASLYAELELRDELTPGLQRASKSTDQFDDRVAKSTSGLTRYQKAALTTGVALGGAAIRAAIDWETAFTGVTKTVDGTDAELSNLESTLLRMSRQGVTSGMDNAAVELAGIAEIAGQLGVGVNDVAKFTDVVAQLGMTTNIAGEEAALLLAQFANITKMDLNDMDRLGSTVVALGNNMATTERDIVVMSQRLAGAGELAGMTEGEILALAAAISSTGIKAEAGGTAMSRVMKDITTAIHDTSEDGQEQLDALARLSGRSADQFAQDWGSDPARVLADFVAGLGDVEEGSRLAYLEMLGFDDIRVSDSLLRLAGNSDLLYDALDIQSDAWEENTALQEEAGKRFDTTAAQLNRLENNLNAVAIAAGDVALPVLNTGLEAGSQLFDIGHMMFGGDISIEPPTQEEIDQALEGFLPGDLDIDADATTTVHYTVQAGDTPSSIAEEIGTTTENVIAALPEGVTSTTMPIDLELEIVVSDSAEFSVATTDLRVLEAAARDLGTSGPPLSGFDKAMIGLNVTVKEFTGLDLPFVDWGRDIQGSGIVETIGEVNEALDGLPELVATAGADINPISIMTDPTGAIDKFVELVGFLPTRVNDALGGPISIDLIADGPDWLIGLFSGSGPGDPLDPNSNAFYDMQQMKLAPGYGQGFQYGIGGAGITGTPYTPQTSGSMLPFGLAGPGSMAGASFGGTSGVSASVNPDDVEDIVSELDDAVSRPREVEIGEGWTGVTDSMEAVISDATRDRHIVVSWSTLMSEAGVEQAAADSVENSLASMGGMGGRDGYASGGWTGSGPTDEAAGTVHRGEYVVPARGAAVVMPSPSGLMLQGGAGDGTAIYGDIHVYGVQDIEALYDQIQQEKNRRA